MAVGASGTVSISTDTTNWTESPTATANNLNAIIYASNKFVAVGDGGAVETSTDGTNWVWQNSGTTNALSAIAYGNGKFVAVGRSAVIASPNAVNWTPAVSGITGATGVAAGSNGFVAVFQSTQNAYFSADGLNWTAETFSAPDGPLGSGPVEFDNDIVTYANGAYLIGAHQHIFYPVNSVVDDFIFSSADGSNWSTNRLGTLPLQPPSLNGFNYDFL